MSDSEALPQGNNMKDHGDEDVEETDKKSVESPRKSSEAGSPKKSSPKKENSSKLKDEQSDEEESEEEEPKPGLLDLPLEVSGSRQRKKVERLVVSFTPSGKDKAEVPLGRGTPLGECPRIENEISKHKAEDLKNLHKVLFNRPGTSTEIKRNMRKFRGFPFDESSAEYDKKKKMFQKFTVTVQKQILAVLDLDRSGTSEDRAERALRFLLSPADSKKPLLMPKKRNILSGTPQAMCSVSMSVDEGFTTALGGSVTNRPTQRLQGDPASDGMSVDECHGFGVMMESVIRNIPPGLHRHVAMCLAHEAVINYHVSVNRGSTGDL